jgi:hypothetical protein
LLPALFSSERSADQHTRIARINLAVCGRMPCQDIFENIEHYMYPFVATAIFVTTQALDEQLWFHNTAHTPSHPGQLPQT